MERTKTEEEKLWVAVLAKAAEDACISVNNLVRHEGYPKSILRGQAVAWFKSKSDDFQLVCELAGRNPEYVYTTMMKRIQAEDYDPRKEQARLKNEEKIHEKDKKLINLEQAWKQVKYLKYAHLNVSLHAPLYPRIGSITPLPLIPQDSSELFILMWVHFWSDSEKNMF